MATRVPSNHWEHACNNGVFVRNHMPINRDIVAKDGCTKRPEEVMSCGLVSRTACTKLLCKLVPLGTPCLVFKSKVIGSDLMKGKGEWRMAL